MIAGQADRLVSLDDAEGLAGGIPDARPLVVPRSNHLVNVEQPHRFQSAVREFGLS